MLEREPGKRQDGAISSANGPQSLWNHSANPGWSAEEAQVFKLLLKKFGVGKFAQIQSCGLLQGKTASQLCKLAQRLLGQQSLDSFRGLRVDVDRVRADNDAREGVQRKRLLIYNSGPPPGKAETEAARAANQKRAVLHPSMQRPRSSLRRTRRASTVPGSSPWCSASCQPFTSEGETELPRTSRAKVPVKEFQRKTRSSVAVLGRSPGASVGLGTRARKWMGSSSAPTSRTFLPWASRVPMPLTPSCWPARATSTARSSGC